jgi:hypothetical protein
MTLNTGVSEDDDLPSISVDTDVYRKLIEQFYESSIRRYGIDSDQTRMFRLHLSAHAAQD